MILSVFVLFLVIAIDTDVRLSLKFCPVLYVLCRSQPPANKGTYSQVGFSYGGSGKEDALDADEDGVDDDEDDEDEEEEFDSNDSDDEGMETIAKQFGVKRYGWLVYMDKKAKAEEKRQKELIKGDPSIVSCKAHVDQ